MKTYYKILLTVLVIMIFAVSCRKTDEFLLPPAGIDESTTIPLNISVGLTPIIDNTLDIELKTTFYEGDVIIITNPNILDGPAILISDGCEGKDKALFSGELKIKKGASLVSGTTQLSAALKNTIDTTRYNNGIQFLDMKEVTSLKDGFEKYGYWSCDNFTYNPENLNINLVQNTVFIQLNRSYTGAAFVLSLGGAYCCKDINNNNTLFAVPFGIRLVNKTLNVDTTMNAKNRLLYNINAGVPDNSLRGLFSVSTGKIVCFSKGNLQYRPKDGAWRLAPNQYHRCFNYDMNVGQNYSEWMGDNEWTDLFGFGTWLDGGCPYLTSYKIDDYNTSFDDYGNLIGSCVIGPEWTVLTRSEWNYLLKARPNASNKRMFVKVGDVSGLILFPDDVNFMEEKKSEYSIEEWEQIESDYCAVFLPATGYRYSESVRSSSSFCLYWTKTLVKDDDYYGYILEFSSNNDSEYEEPHYYGHAVRLVSVVNEWVSNTDRCIAVESIDKAPDSWSTQFFIVTNGITKGQIYELSMSVKADYESSSSVHVNYADGSFSGNLTNRVVKYTPEWTNIFIRDTFKCNGNRIAFNLNRDYLANKYYFDDISLKINGTEEVINGDCSNDDRQSFEVGSFTPTFIDKATIKQAIPRSDNCIEKGSTVSSQVFTKYTSFPYYVMAYTPTFDSENGLVSTPKFKANGDVEWYQYFVADDVPTIIGKKYSIEVEIRGDKAGSFNANMGWSWEEEPVSTTVSFSQKWETKRFYFDGPVQDCRCNIIFQPGDFPHTIYIKSLKIIYEGD